MNENDDTPTAGPDPTDRDDVEDSVDAASPGPTESEFEPAEDHQMMLWQFLACSSLLLLRVTAGRHHWSQ